MAGERDNFATTATWFVAGGAVTAVFSASLAALTTRATLAEVLAVGMVVPTFTWVVQLAASAIALPSTLRSLYWGDLGYVCFVGSVALLPAAIVNLTLADAPRWPSAVNVLVSVAIMAVDLFRRTARHGLSHGWAASWCATIALNIAIFLWVSRDWWRRE